MKCLVRFFPLKHNPDDETKERLEWLQEQLEIYNAELAYMVRDMDEWQKWITRESSHQKTRQSWRLIKAKEAE